MLKDKFDVTSKHQCSQQINIRCHNLRENNILVRKYSGEKYEMGQEMVFQKINKWQCFEEKILC